MVGTRRSDGVAMYCLPMPIEPACDRPYWNSPIDPTRPKTKYVPTEATVYAAAMPWKIQFVSRTEPHCETQSRATLLSTSQSE